MRKQLEGTLALLLGTFIWGMAFIAIPAIWQLSGYCMALYLAGLRASHATQA